MIDSSGQPSQGGCCSCEGQRRRDHPETPPPQWKRQEVGRIISLGILPQQFIGGDAEDAAQLEKLFRIRKDLAALPAADVLRGDAQPLCQNLLREVGSQPPLGDFFADGNGKTPFANSFRISLACPGGLLNIPGSGPPVPPAGARRRSSPDRHRSGLRFRRRCSPGSCCRRRGG